MTDRCTLVRAFVEFELLPELLGRAPGRDLTAGASSDDSVGFRPSPSVEAPIQLWTDYLAETGANMDHVEEDDLPSGVAQEAVLAQDAWVLAERLHLLWTEGRTMTGDRLARIAQRPWDRRTMADDRTIVRTIAEGIRKHYVGGDGLEMVPFLREAAQILANTDHVWARHCPGLLLVEFEALIYWGFENPEYALRLRNDLVKYRGEAMKIYRAPPPDDGDPADIQLVHEDATIRLYLEREDLAARTDLTVTEVRSTAMLLTFAELLEESLLTPSSYLTAPADDDV